jgi:hypothetical protein
MLYVIGLGVLVGFALGHFSFRVKGRWCRRCGLGLVCPDCAGLLLRHSSLTGDDSSVR